MSPEYVQRSYAELRGGRSRGSTGSEQHAAAGTEFGRRQFLRGIAAAGAMAGTGGLLAACGGSSSSGQTQHLDASRRVRRGGNLKLGLTGGSSSDTLDPHKSLTYIDTSRLQSLYQPLVQLDAQAQVEYVLAESITPHRVAVRVGHPRCGPGVTFHDGKAFTADDVLFTLPAGVHQRLTGQVRPRPDRPGAHQGAGPAHRAGPADQALLQLRRAAGGVLVQPVHRAGRLQPGQAGRHRGRSSTRASRPASAACSPGTRTTGSPGCPTWTR